MSKPPRWSERQRRMLSAMGVRWWAGAEPPAGPGAQPPAAEEAMPVPVPVAVAAAAPTAPRGLARAAPTPEAPLPAPAPVPTPVPTLVPLPSAGQAADLDVPALAAALQACRACGLCQERRQAVPGAGPQSAGWMVVGEAPGADEDAAGQPFVGAPGQLLDAMLRAMGLAHEGALPRAPVFVTHAVKCAPPSRRMPSAAELAACKPYLLRQIELVNPRVLLVFGRAGAQSLLGSDEPLGRLRGRVHRLDDGRAVIVTYPPSYLLRHPHEKPKVWEDLCLALDTFEAAAGDASGTAP